VRTSGSATCRRGRSFPLGATLAAAGVNFSIYAKHGTAVQLLLFDAVDAPQPSRMIDLDRRANRTYHYWHVFVPDLVAGQVYGYRVACLSGRAEEARNARCEVCVSSCSH
jgi:glycogen operon protein